MESTTTDNSPNKQSPESKTSQIFEKTSSNIVNKSLSNIYEKKFSAIPDNPIYYSLFEKQLAVRDLAQIEKMKQLYPEVLKLLFQKAQKNAQGQPINMQDIVDKSFNSTLSKEEALCLLTIAKSQSEGSIFQQNIMIDDKKLQPILVNLSRQITIPEDHLKTLVWLFRQYLENCAHPSHVSVEMELEMNDEETTLNNIIQTALQVKKPSERSKALSTIVSSIARNHDEEKAVDLIRTIKVADKNKPLNSILDIILRQGKSSEGKFDLNWYKAACDEALSLTNPDEKNRLLQRIAIAVARYGEVNTAFATAAKISSAEARAYAYSGIIQALLNIGLRDSALQILPTITDLGAKEDAITYIVMDIGKKDSYDDVIDFIESLTTQHQKNHAAKILASILASHNDKEHVEELNERYSLR